MSTSQIPAHAAPLDGANLSAAQADFVMRLLNDFRPFTDKDARDADALRAQLRPALAAFDAANA